MVHHGRGIDPGCFQLTLVFVDSLQRNIECDVVHGRGRRGNVTVTDLAGLAPFGCVFIEAYFVLSSFWGYRYYFVYGFLAQSSALMADAGHNLSDVLGLVLAWDIV